MVGPNQLETLKFGTAQGYVAPFMHGKGVITDPALNQFHPRTWEKGINHAPDHVDYSTVNSSANTGYNRDIKFELDSSLVLGGKVQYRYKRGAVSGLTLGTDQFVRFLDFEGYNSIEKVTWLYDNKKEFLTQTGEEMIWDMQRYASKQKRALLAKQQNGDKSCAERNALALASDKWVIVDLQVPWDNDDFRKGIPMNALPAKIVCIITMKPIAKCIQTNAGSGTPDCSISTAELRVFGVQLGEEYQDYLFDSVSGSGYPVKISTCEKELSSQIEITSVASENIKDIRLPSIKNAVFDLYFIMRKDADVDTATIPSTEAANRDPMRLVVPSSWQLLDGTKEITKRIYGVGSSSDVNSNYNMDDMYHSNLKAYHDKPGLYIPAIHFCADSLEFSATQASESDVYNAKEFSRAGDLKLRLWFDANHRDLAVDTYYVDVYAEVHNTLNYTKSSVRRWLL